MRRALIAVPVAIVLAAALLFATRSDDAPGAGPLTGADPIDETQPVPIGEPYDMGSVATFLDNRGDKPITIDRARLIGVAGPVELLEIRTHPVRAGAPGGDVYGGGIVKTSEQRFPTNPFAGHNTVPVPKLFSETGNPDEGLQLLFRVRMTERGVGRWEALEIFYRAGDKEHREVFPWSVWLCAPADEYMGDPPNDRDCGNGEPFGDRVLG